MKIGLPIVLGLLTGITRSVSADPLLTSWYTVHAGEPARIYRSDADKAAGRSVTTWSNRMLSQTTPAPAGIEAVYYSSNWVYIRSTGLGSQIMGPWYMNPQHTRAFPNLPTDQHILFCLPRHPVLMKGYSRQNLGDIGMTVDGVPIFDANDAFSYSHADGKDADPRAGIGPGDRIWERDAYVNEGVTFDASLGHQQNWGRYHYHADAVALRYELGDHVDFDAATKTYHESTGAPVKHSPILGWMRDGCPLYGPYGYANPTNPASGLRRMVSGYVLRDGRNGTDNLSQTGRRTLPAWDARIRGRSTQLDESETGPDVTARYPLGHFLQDYAFLGDLGKKPGQDYDLDELNGRWCVTPEFPHGVYAYFTAIAENGSPVYPYTMGRSYHNQPYGGQARKLLEPVTTWFEMPKFESSMTAPPDRPSTSTVVWTGQDNGQYQRR